METNCDTIDKLNNEYHKLVEEYGYICLQQFKNYTKEVETYREKMRNLWKRAKNLKYKNMCENILYLLNNFYLNSGSSSEEFSYQESEPGCDDTD